MTSKKEYECGPGRSVKEIADKLAAWLPKLLKRYEIRKVCDFGCGDLYWMDMVEFDGEYVGYDEVIRKSAIERAKKRGWKLREANIFDQDIEPCDLAIVKDVFIHYSDKACLQLLQKVKSKAKYLLSESHNAHEWPRPTKHQKTADGKRYVCSASATNLREILGEPMEQVEILPGKIMGIWKL